MSDHVPPTKSKLLRTAIAMVVLLGLGIFAFRITSKMRKRPKKKGSTKALSLKVETKAASFRSMTLYLRGYGTAESDQKLDIVPEVSGRVVYTVKPFKVGTYAKRGRLLLRINPSDYSLEYKRLKAQISSLKKQISIAARAYKVSRRNLSRRRRLVQRKALDQSSYEQAQQQVLDRGQRLESLRQGLQMAVLQMRRAGLNLNRTAIRAPFAARITKGQLTRGAFVAAGRSVGTIESVEAVEIPISFPLDKLRKIRDDAGKPVPLQRIPTQLKGLPPVVVKANGVRWDGRVSRVGASVDLATRTLTLFVRVDLKKLKQIGNLLPGTFCNVKIPARKIAQAMELPAQALHNDRYVYLAVKGKSGRQVLAKRAVEVAYQDPENVTITSGVKPGDKVIISQLTDPIEGTPVFTSDK